MRIHAIQTGFVKIKSAQVEGQGHGLARRLAIVTDRKWTEWLPTYAWAIEHKEGVIVVDTGQGAHLLETGTSYHPFARWEVVFRIDREEEIGPQLLRMAGWGTTTLISSGKDLFIHYAAPNSLSPSRTTRAAKRRCFM